MVFSISSLKFPTTITPSLGAGIFALEQIDPPVTVTTSVEALPEITVTESESGLLTGNTGTFSVIVEPRVIFVGTTVFSLALDPDDPRPGEFTYNGPSFTLHGDFIGLSYRAIGYLGTYGDGIIPTTRVVSFSGLFAQYNAEGTITINRALEDHPSLSFTFTVQNRSISTIIANYRNNTTVTIDRVPYRVTSVEINRLSERLYPGRVAAVTINFQGIWGSFGNPSQSPLDTPILLKPLVNQNTNGEININTLCSQVGVPFVGKNIPVKVRKDIDAAASTTVRQELEKVAEIKQGFIFWSDPSVTIRPWYSTPVRFIPKIEVLSESVSYSVNGVHDAWLGVQLSKVYDQCRWQPDTENNDQTQNEGGIIVLKEYENARDRNDLVFPPGYSRFGQSPSLDNSVLRDMSNNWDAGGPTKTERIKYLLNGTVFLTEETVYGFVFTSKDTYDLSGENITFEPSIGINNPVNYWRIVSEQSTLRLFDEFGYLIKEQTTGTRLARPAQETEALQQIQAQRERNGATDPATIAFLDQFMALYEPRSLPISDSTIYELDEMTAYYDDLQPESTREGEQYNEAWIPPRFVRKKIRVNNSSQIEANPESTETNILPPITFGLNETFVEETQIAIPFNAQSKIRKPEKYLINTYNQSQSGQGLGNTLAISTSTENSGRPGVQERIEQIPSQRPAPATSSNPDLGKYTYWFSSFGGSVNTSQPEKEQISFDYVDDPVQALAIARLRLAKENTKNALTCSIDVRYRSYYKEGDRVLWDGVLWRILSLSINLEINPNKKTEGTITLNLGRELNPSVVMVKAERTSPA